MTAEEIKKRYLVPVSILQEYEQLSICRKKKDENGILQYDDSDLERISLMLTLHGIGFETEETLVYMEKFLAGKSTQAERILMLEQKRGKLLDEIHDREHQISKVDYLRHQLRGAKET